MGSYLMGKNHIDMKQATLANNIGLNNMGRRHKRAVSLSPIDEFVVRSLRGKLIDRQ